MTLWEALGPGLALFLDPGILALIALGVPIGLVVGIIPGISGLTALALLLPVTYGMDPLAGLVFLVAVHSVACTGGALTSVVIGIPGDPVNAATVLDGYPMTRKGQGGYAVGAAMMSSGLGGIAGAVVLILLLPVLQRVVLSFGSPETFLLAATGVCLIGVLDRGSLAKGLIAGGLGILLGLFGYQGLTGIPRFWFGSEYLLDGFRIVPFVIGLFAVPEILALAREAAIAERPPQGLPRAQVLAGMKAPLEHWWLLLRSSFIGVVVGIVPGLGGVTASFLSYASAKQTERTGPEFGTGVIEGVIAPESSDNAKEGGALATTLAFGIPGSAGMAVLLGAVELLGLQPGPSFLKHHMDLAIALALALAGANVLGAGLMLAFSGPLVRITVVRGRILAPLLLVLVVLGTYASGNNPMDVLWLLVFGALGCVFKALHYSRPTLILGFILGELIERYLHISLQAYGYEFVLRPGCLAIMAVAVLGFVAGFLRNVSRAGRKALAPLEQAVGAGAEPRGEGAWRLGNVAEILFPMLVAVFVGALIAVEFLLFSRSYAVIRFPLLVGLVVCALCGFHLWRLLRHGPPAQQGQAPADPPPTLSTVLPLLALIPAAFVLGFPAGMSLYVLLYLKGRGESWPMAGALAMSCLAVVYGLFGEALRVPLPAGYFGWP